MPDDFYSPPNIWCLDVYDGLIVAGCSDGGIEFWDSTNGSLKYQHKSSRNSGIASIKCMANRYGFSTTNSMFYTFILTLHEQNSVFHQCLALQGHDKFPCVCWLVYSP